MQTTPATETQTVILWVIDTDPDHSEIVARRAAEASNHFDINIVVSKFTDVQMALADSGQLVPDIVLCDLREVADHDRPTGVYNILRGVGMDQLVCYYSAHITHDCQRMSQQIGIPILDKGLLENHENQFFIQLLRSQELI